VTGFMQQVSGVEKLSVVYDQPAIDDLDSRQKGLIVYTALRNRQTDLAEEGEDTRGNFAISIRGHKPMID
jgi:hypothetical protein